MKEYVIPMIFSLATATFSVLYQRYHTRHDQWRDQVDKKLSDQDTRVAVLETIAESNQRQFDEIKQTLRDMHSEARHDTQELRSLMLGVLGAKQKNDS